MSLISAGSISLDSTFKSQQSSQFGALVNQYLGDGGATYIRAHKLFLVEIKK
jgi:hypothetical protein